MLLQDGSATYMYCVSVTVDWLKCVCVCVVALPAVSGIQLFDVTHNAMKARWDSVYGASGYMLLYAPLTDDGVLDEKEVVKEKHLKCWNA